MQVSVCMLGYFNGLKKTTVVMVQGSLTASLVRIPRSYYFSSLEKANMMFIGIAVPASAAVSLVMCIIYYFIINRKSKPKTALPDGEEEIAQNTPQA